MNKKLISAAVLLGVAGTSSAVNVNPDGIGQVLLYPYYTVNDDKSTFINIVNTTNQAKAVKVRLSEGVNTWEVLDFNLYLSPYDVWAGAITKDSDGDAILKSPDTSCTVPDNSKLAAGTKLRSFNIDEFAADSGEVVSDDLKNLQNRLSEGHLEVIDMGDIQPTYLVGTENLKAAVTHNDQGVPVNCGLLQTAFAGDWNNDSTIGMNAASGGLFGSATVMDLAKGIGASYDATALQGVILGTAHSHPGTSFPNLNGDIETNGDNDIDGNVGSTVAYLHDGTSVTPFGFSSTLDAVSAALAVTSINNEYVNFGDFTTDWVVSFPTKHYYVNPNTVGDSLNAPGQVGLLADADEDGEYNYNRQPFNGSFGVEVNFKIWDREEQNDDSVTLDFSPQRGPAQDELPYEVNVLEFNTERNVLKSFLKNPVPGAYDSGWAQLTFTNNAGIVGYNYLDNTFARVAGVPAIGFAAMQTVTEGTTLSNYTSFYDHKYTRAVSGE